MSSITLFEKEMFKVFNYNLEFNLSNNKNFNAVEIINLQLKETATKIVFEGEHLKITKARLYDKFKVYNAKNIIYEENKIIFDFDYLLIANIYSLYLEFSGIINNNIKYVYLNNNKATFNLKIITSCENYIISNMPITQDKIINSNIKEITFNETPLMSSNLLSFYVNSNKLNKLTRNIKKFNSNNYNLINIYANNKHNIKLLEFVLDAVCKLLSYFEEYYCIDYELNKLDIISLDEEESSKEESLDESREERSSWGLLFFDSKDILCDLNNIDLNSKINILVKIACKITQMWFGNLTSIINNNNSKWFIQGYILWSGWEAVNILYPELKAWEMFIIKYYNNALDIDSLKSTPALNNSTNINNSNNIVYYKSSCIIKMLVNYVEKNTFKLSIREFIKKYKYKYADISNLYNILSEKSEINISDMIIDWVNYANYPVIKVKVTWSNLINISQSQIFNNQIMSYYNSGVQEKKKKWTAPIERIFGSNKIVSLDKNMFGLNITNDDYNKIIKLNINQNNYYRTLYSDERLDFLKDYIKYNILDNIDRAEIINNLFAFVKLNLAHLSKVLRYLNVYCNENNYLVYQCLINNINYLCEVFINYDIIYELLNNIKQNIRSDININYKFITNRLSDSEIYNNYNIKELDRLLMKLDYIKVIYKEESNKEINKKDYIMKLFNNYINNNCEDVIINNIRQEFFVEVINKCNIDIIINLYNKFNNQDLRLSVLNALGYSKNKEELHKALDFNFKSGQVLIKYQHVLINSASSYKYNKECWEYLVNNFDSILVNNKLTENILAAVLKNMYDKIFRENAVKILEKYNLSKHKNIIDQSLERAIVGESLISREKVFLENFYNKEDKEDKEEEDKEEENLEESLEKINKNKKLKLILLKK